MINNNLIYSSFFISGLFLLLLSFFPNLDLAFSSIFFDKSCECFIYKQNVIVLLLYLSIPIITKIFIAISIIYLVCALIFTKNIKTLYQSSACYLILSACLGPGLIVNTALKTYHGRARPAQITQFNGSKLFTSPFVYTDQCDSNCAFPSGHAAMAFYFSSLAYVLGANNKMKFTKIYAFSLLFGSFVGASRIAMGGHFLSDVVASCFIILLINHLVYLSWKKYG